MGRRQVAELFAGLFKDQALLIGGLLAEHPVDDAFVWRLMRNLDALRRRVMTRLRAGDARPSREAPAAPHPAVQEFLHPAGSAHAGRRAVCDPARQRGGSA